MRPPVQAQSAGDQKTASSWKPVLAADEARQVADQRAVRNSVPSAGRSFRSCRSAPPGRRRESLRSVKARSRRRCRSSRSRPAPGGADGHDGGQLGAERRASRTLAMPLVDDREARLAVVDAVLERIRAEQHRERHRHRAEAVERDVRDRGPKRCGRTSATRQARATPEPAEAAARRRLRGRAQP